MATRSRLGRPLNGGDWRGRPEFSLNAPSGERFLSTFLRVDFPMRRSSRIRRRLKPSNTSINRHFTSDPVAKGQYWFLHLVSFPSEFHSKSAGVPGSPIFWANLGIVVSGKLFSWPNPANLPRPSSSRLTLFASLA